MKTILAPVYLHEYLKIKLLEEKNSSYLVDYQFIDLNSYINRFLDDDKDGLLNVNAAFNITKTNMFKDVIIYPVFKKQVITFYRFLLRNDIDTIKLPENNNTNSELKELLNSLNKLNFKEKQYPDMKNKLQKMNFSNFDIYQGYSTIEEQKIYDIMYKNQAVKKELPKLKGDYEVFQTLNMHQEIEAVAQDISKNNYNAKEINIIITNKDYQKPLQQIFDIYNIPYGLTEDISLNNTNLKFKLLIDLYINPTIKNYRKAIINNSFPIDSNKSIDKYLTDFVLDFKECTKEFSYYSTLESTLEKRDLKGLIDLEYEANLVQKELIPYLSSLLGASSLKDVLVEIFNILKENNDNKELKKLKTTIESSIDKLNEENIKLFSDTLSTNNYKSNSFTNVIAVTNILKPIPARKISYILGCDQNNYPNFKIAKGYFNQNYLDSIGYYSQSEQYNYYMNQIHWIYESGSIIKFYSSIAQYNGKAKSIAFEIDNLKIAKFINITSNEYTTNIHHRLSLEKAEKAFIRENNIYGSISSFEKYFSCPYAYFLNYGLKLYPKQIIDLQANTVGTATHAIFEKLVKENPKDYGKADFNTINKSITSYFDQLRLIFRNRFLEINSIQYRLASMLEKTFKFYLSMEESTKFIPTYFEKEVFEKMASVNDINLYIKGYIDRIDTYNKGFRVLDYKSSNYTLVDNHILCGNKLQLVTYTKIIKDLLGLEPYGSYYSFYRSGKISVPAYTYSITKKIDFFDKQTLTDEFNKQYKLSGFSYEYDDNCDDSTHIKGITNKNKIRGKAIIFSQIEKALESIYEHLIQELCQGKIDLTPIEGACTYCHYQSICNYRGKKIKNYQQIVDIDLKNIEEQE
jgi:ATP-dependent helicase/DNAse subunit B